MPSGLSVVLNTLNEAENLPRAIASVKEIADEVIVVDFESTDQTPQIAKKLGAKLFTHKRLKYVEPVRNFMVAKANFEWVLVLDADEEVPGDLSLKIKEIIHQDSVDYVEIPRKNLIFGKWMQHSRWWPDFNIRLFRKGSVKWSDEIHVPPNAEGRKLQLDPQGELAILHHHYDSIEQFLERLNRYTSVQSELKVKNGYKFKWPDLITKPTDEFFSRYFFGEGYKDGIHGLGVSMLQAFSELVLYLKIWQADKFTSSEVKLSDVVSVMRNSEKDLHYWQNDSLYKEYGKLKHRIIRKLHI